MYIYMNMPRICIGLAYVVTSVIQVDTSIGKCSIGNSGVFYVKLYVSIRTLLGICSIVVITRIILI